MPTPSAPNPDSASIRISSVNLSEMIGNNTATSSTKPIIATPRSSITLLIDFDSGKPPL